MRRTSLVSIGAVVYLSCGLALAQEGYFSSWFARVDKTTRATPLADAGRDHDASPGGGISLRPLWQTYGEGITTNNYDGGKRLELIPFEKVEVIFNLPPYLAHHNRAVRDGFGDVAFLVKYRLLSEDEERGNYILTAFIGWSLPTGDHKNGALDAVVTPTIAYGKGFRNFDVQGTGLACRPATPISSDGRLHGITPCNTACFGSSGRKWN
jgi:hypothetical protein